MIFFIRLCCLVALYNNMLKIFHLCDDFYILLYKATKRLSQIKKIINFHHQFFKPYQMPSALMLKTIFIFRTWTPIVHMQYDVRTYNIYVQSQSYVCVQYVANEIFDILLNAKAQTIMKRPSYIQLLCSFSLLAFCCLCMRD